jgi:ribose transport system substrate-binding protein
MSSRFNRQEERKMFTKRSRHRLGSAAVVALACAGLAACGSGGSAGGGSSSASANVAAARTAIQPYVGKPSAFPVDRPLTKRLPAGSRLAYLQCVTPFCALLGQLHGMAAKMLGTQIDVVKASGSSDSIQAALSSIAAKRPAALLLPAVNLGALGDSLKKLTAAGIPVAGAGVMGGPEQGISAPINGPYTISLGGRLLADWAIVNGAAQEEIAFYGVPELDFSNVEESAFKAEMHENCPDCNVRYVDIPIATIGNSAPSRVVSDLQSHPKTEMALFSSLEAAIGLPAALRTAGIEVKTNGFAPTPSNLQDIKTGGLDAAIGLDAGVLAFSQMDAAVRLATDQPLTALEKKGAVPIQLLTEKDLNFDVSKGWSGYPDFAQRFGKLWSSGK